MHGVDFDRVKPEYSEGASHQHRRSVLDALGKSESKSTKCGESLAAVHKPEIAAVESRAKVETAAPRSAKPKTAKSPTPTARTSLRRRPPPSRSM